MKPDGGYAANPPRSTTGRRAQRFKIEMKMQYRAAGEERWRDGKIKDISSSGVFFDAENSLELTTRLEMWFVLPVKLASRPGGEILCSGQVVRRILPELPAGPALIAATISKYRFFRQPDLTGPGRS